MIEQKKTDKRLPDMVNLNGAADLLDLSPQYVHRIAERGQLVGYKIGSAWWFRRAVIERFKAQREAPPASDEA